MNPLLKWPGGKRQLVARIREHFPEQFGRYFEPLCGGAAVFFSLETDNATLNDANTDLIECYESVAEQPEAAIERAARMLYLCRLSFNGIYRVNLRGEYNVPYGKKTYW